MNTARIIGLTQPIEALQMTPEEFIVYMARISNPDNQLNHDTAPKLLKWCFDQGHYSIFEMIDVIMDITTTRDIGRQILRHRSFNFQEFSQRYANPVEKLGFAIREARLQDNKNRQNSILTDDTDLQKTWREKQQQVIDVSTGAYNWAVENNIAKEQSRVVLPEGLTVTHMYMKGNLRNWIHYCKLRIKHGTQLEHVNVATQCWNETINYFPSLENMIN